MIFIIGLLTVVLVLNCVVLILLILIQLPKKEAGAGLAFGGAASDALFGAGSGTVLTKVTKYATGSFFALALILSVLQGRISHSQETEFGRKLREQQSKQPPVAAESVPALAEEAPSAVASNNATTVATNSAAPPAVSPTTPATAITNPAPAETPK